RSPSRTPSAEPSRSPSRTPSAEPSRSTSRTPSAEPSRSPSRTPSAELKTENRKGNPYNTMERNSYNSPISSYQGIRDTDYKGVRERQNPIKRNEISGNKYELKIIKKRIKRIRNYGVILFN